MLAALPLEVLVQVLASLDEPPQGHYFATTCARPDTDIAAGDLLDALDVCDSEARRVRNNGVWDPCTSLLGRVAEAHDALLRCIGIAPPLPAPTRIRTRDQFDSTVGVLLRDMRQLVEGHVPGRPHWLQSPTTGWDAFNPLVMLARALQETTLAPGAAVVCWQFARAVRHPHAVHMLWRPWTLRRWSHLTLMAIAWPATLDWRAYARRRLRVRGAAGEHVVDNCVDPACKLTLDAMKRVGRLEYRCDDCNKHVRVVRDVEDLLNGVGADAERVAADCCGLFFQVHAVADGAPCTWKARMCE